MYGTVRVGCQCVAGIISSVVQPSQCNRETGNGALGLWLVRLQRVAGCRKRSGGLFHAVRAADAGCELDVEIQGADAPLR